MLIYDRNKPLIFIHTPKTAGVSLRSIFKSWFGDNLYFHYADNNKGILPVKRNINKLHSYQNPVVIYGHFNKSRNFGINDYYPDATQFITVLREPFERHVSLYFYLRKGRQKQFGPKIPEKEIEYHLINSKGSFLNNFPKQVTFDNYKEIIEQYFIEIGIVEKLDMSLQRIANKLGFNFRQADLQKLNTTDPDQEIPYWIKDQYIDLHRLEYTVYDYVLSKYI